MACCFEELEDYAVTPMLISPCVPEQCCERSSCYPSLPRCPKGEIVYCEKSQNKHLKRTNPVQDNCCSEFSKQSRSPELPRREPSCPSQEYCPRCNNPCKSIKTKYVIPCYRYEDGRIVTKLPVSAFKRNGIQDQEHSKLMGTANFLMRCPRDVSIECEVNPIPIKVKDPIKVPLYDNCTLDSCLLKKKPIAVALEDILDD